MWLGYAKTSDWIPERQPAAISTSGLDGSSSSSGTFCTKTGWLVPFSSVRDFSGHRFRILSLKIGLSFINAIILCVKIKLFKSLHKEMTWPNDSYHISYEVFYSYEDTKWCTMRYIMDSCAWSLHCCRVFQLRSSFKSITLLVRM